MKYQNYTSKDFVADAFFQKWVLAPDAETNAFWEDWVQKHPFKRLDVAEAREIIQVLGFTTDVKINNDFVQVWNNIQEELQVEEAAFSEPVAGLNHWSKHFQKFAAVLVGLLIISVAVLHFKPQKKEDISYTTAFGQVKKIYLPDSSQVILNANSVLTFAANWEDEDEPREVWLKGEAFFSVLKKKTLATKNVKFKVHTQNLTVEVLGTKFNVNERRNNTAVVLQEGKVKIDLQKPAAQPAIFMQPGELVGYSNAQKQVIKRKVDPQNYTFWVKNELAFHKATLKEIAMRLEDDYGYQVTFQDEALANQRFTGTIPGNNLNLLFTALTKLYHIEIIQNQNHLLIAPNKSQKP